MSKQIALIHNTLNAMRTSDLEPNTGVRSKWLIEFIYENICAGQARETIQSGTKLCKLSSNPELGNNI